MTNTTPKPTEHHDPPKKPQPQAAAKTLITKIESSLRRIEHHTDAIYQTAQDLAKSHTNLHRHAHRFQSALEIARRDLADLRARIASQKPEFSAHNHTAPPSSSTNRPASHSDQTPQRSLTILYGPPTLPLHLSPDFRPT